MATMADVQPFRINVPDDVLVDLRRRLAATRWPEAECVDDWTQGIPLAYTRELAEYWATEYDWRAGESALNQFDQFTTEIDGLDIHFIHQRSPHPRRLPARDHARLAWIDHRIRQGHRAADRPDRTRRPRRGRLSRGVPIAARVRLLRQTDHDGLERRQDRKGMGDADGPPRLPALRRPGRGLGLGGHRRNRSQRRSLRGHPPQHADRQRRLPMPAEPHRRAEGRPRGGRPLPEGGLRLLQAAGHPTADGRLRPGGLPRRADGLDRREVLVMDGLRRPSRERTHAATRCSTT